MTRVVIVGAGKGGKALIELLLDIKSVRITGVVDKDPEAPGMVLARGLNLPAGTDLKTFLAGCEADGIFNTTGSADVQEELVKAKPEGVEVIGAHSSKLLWEIIEHYRSSEQEMRRTKTYTELIFEIAPNAIFTVDTQKRVTNWNRKAEEITGYNKEEVMGKECRIFADYPCPTKCDVFYKGVEKPIIGAECRIRRKDGKEREIVKSSDLLRDEDGNVTGAIEVFEDVTERNKFETILREGKEELGRKTVELKVTNEAINSLNRMLEEKNLKLTELNETKTKFVATVSHELRTPLAIIGESIEQMLDGISGEITREQKEVLDMAKDNIERLKRIINNLLDISKIEAGKIELKKEIVDIGLLAEGVASTFKPHASHRGIKIKITVPQEDLKAMVDRDRIVQVFTNLIGNALKFTMTGQIEVSAGGKNNEIECRVVDTGIGIKPEDLNKVFGKFEQFERDKKTGEKGAGLGLAIARELVEMHGGKIWVESEYGKGTTFVFTLPRLK
jgi:PAS domain S-box-containing protein